MLRRNKFDILIFMLLLITGIFLGYQFMYEFKWDFANYHYYNAWAFLNGRLDIDIAPASVNTYFNPLLDVPFYFLVKYFNDYPALVSAIQGSYLGVLLFAFYKICLLYFDGKNQKKIFQVLLAMIIGVTGFATFMQVGTTTNEIQIAIFVLWSFYLLAKEVVAKSGRKMVYVWAGLLLGLALGLKLTTVIYCVSSGLCLILFYRHIDNPWSKIMIFALSGLMGFLLVNGFWMWTMWEHFQNPFFPFANAIFESEFFDNFNFSDHRYIPTTMLSFVFYPFLWALHFDTYVAETIFVDIRFALLFLIAVIWLIAVIRKKTKISKRDQFLYLFLFISYVIWIGMFAIIRYLVPVEMLVAIVIVQALFAIKVKKWTSEIIFYSLALIIIFVLVTTPYQSVKWGTRQDDKKVIDVEDIEVKDNSLILLYNMPGAAAGAYYAQQAENVKIIGTKQMNAQEMRGADFSDRKKFNELKKEVIANHKNDIIALVRMWGNRKCLLSIVNDELLNKLYCRELKNNLDKYLYVCRYEKWDKMKNESKGLK